jgi:hypothetical protein
MSYNYIYRNQKIDNKDDYQSFQNKQGKCKIRRNLLNSRIIDSYSKNSFYKKLSISQKSTHISQNF